MLDTSNSYMSDDRPSLERRLFIRHDISPDEERHCLLDRTCGFKIPDTWLPSSALVFCAGYLRPDRLAVLPIGGWGLTIVLDVSAERKGLKRIALGFDFDFNPVCFLEDSSEVKEHVHRNLNDHINWSNLLTDNVKWCEVHEGSRVYRQADHDGIWALRGHRLYGLDVVLAASPGHNGSLVVLERNEEISPLVWEVLIDDLAGPFAYDSNKKLQDEWGSRSDFQAFSGLKLTSEDLEEGDAIPESLSANQRLDGI